MNFHIALIFKKITIPIALLVVIALSFTTKLFAFDRDYADFIAPRPNVPSLSCILTAFFMQQYGEPEEKESAQPLQDISELIAQYAGTVLGDEAADHSFCYVPDEVTEKFRKQIIKHGIFSDVISRAPTVREILRDFEQQFPGFQVICDHLDCEGCSGVLKTNIDPTPKDIFACIKEKFFRNGCWYREMQCFDYAPYRLILEQYADNELLAFLIILSHKRARGFDPLMSNFLELEKVKNPEDGKLVIYSNGGDHYGIYSGNGIVESKWGSTPIVFQHRIFQVPELYGTKVAFYKVKLKELPPNFIIDTAQKFLDECYGYKEPNIAMQRLKLLLEASKKGAGKSA